MISTTAIRAALAAAALLVVPATACGGSSDADAPTSTTAPGTTAASDGVPQELRDFRYCEVIPTKVDGDSQTSYVYNTLGYNLCPPDQWNALTEDEVNQEYGSQSAQLNGPRHWVIDSAQGSDSSNFVGQTFVFGGIQMAQRGQLTSPAGTPVVGNEFFVPNTVSRTTVWTYKAGRPIFQLTSPTGDVYVMQSYSQIADPTLTYEQLPNLAGKLALPDGWTYTSRAPTEDLVLDTNGTAHVVNDNLYNSYQRT
jgi:hypothetical protein